MCFVVNHDPERKVSNHDIKHWRFALFFHALRHDWECVTSVAIIVVIPYA